jgi:hypothetical protein
MGQPALSLSWVVTPVNHPACAIAVGFFRLFLRLLCRDRLLDTSHGIRPRLAVGASRPSALAVLALTTTSNFDWESDRQVRLHGAVQTRSSRTPKYVFKAWSVSNQAASPAKEPSGRSRAYCFRIEAPFTLRRGRYILLLACIAIGQALRQKGK